MTGYLYTVRLTGEGYYAGVETSIEFSVLMPDQSGEGVAEAARQAWAEWHSSPDGAATTRLASVTAVERVWVDARVFA